MHADTMHIWTVFIQVYINTLHASLNKAHTEALTEESVFGKSLENSGGSNKVRQSCRQCGREDSNGDHLRQGIDVLERESRGTMYITHKIPTNIRLWERESIPEGSCSCWGVVLLYRWRRKRWLHTRRKKQSQKLTHTSGKGYVYMYSFF